MAAIGRNSASENARHTFFNFEWVSGNTKLEMLRVPENRIVIYFLSKTQVQKKVYQPIVSKVIGANSLLICKSHS